MDVFRLKNPNFFSPNDKFLNIGAVLSEKPKDFMLRAQCKSYKQCAFHATELVIAPTMLCNFKCPYCFVKDNLKNQLMSKETIDKILNLIKVQGNVCMVEWFGGEPSLVPDLLEYFYHKAYENNIKIIRSLLITNGSFENTDIWPIIEKYITQIQITLDGTKDIHNERRIYKNGKGSFDKILNTLDLLYEKIHEGKVKNNLDVIIRCNIDKNNLLDSITLRNFILDRYDSVFRFEFAKVCKAGIEEYDKNILSDKEWANFLIKLYEEYGILTYPYLPTNHVLYHHCRGNLLRAHRFKLRHPRTTLYFFTTSLQREADLWRLLQKECLLQRWARLRKQADHKAKCYCEAVARSDWADCACITPCFALTKAYVRAC